MCPTIVHCRSAAAVDELVGFSASSLRRISYRGLTRDVRLAHVSIVTDAIMEGIDDHLPLAQ